jgi:2,4-dienoyl-CoA reductase-like NADH-dependent reductase (Old Yellow Enzyme family)
MGLFKKPNLPNGTELPNRIAKAAMEKAWRIEDGAGSEARA